MNRNNYDYIVIGSGFGGAVSACRLAQKGYSVLVIEQGRNYPTGKEFPKSNRDIKNYLWMPLLRFFGPQKITFFKEALILSGVGVGGGSLVYANTLLDPPVDFFKKFYRSDLIDWKNKLEPFYEMAKKMLGVVPNPNFNTEDEILRQISKDDGREENFKNVNVGIYFGDKGEDVDPYFSGDGPKRNACTSCAGCMVGCRHNAKNTLDKNYLYFAQKYGAQIVPLTKVEKIEFLDGVYHVSAKSTNKLFQGKRIFKSKGIVISGGVLGTMELLLKQKYKYKTLPNLSDAIGENILTNSESLCAVTSNGVKLNNGIAITSSYNVSDHTHIEIVKYPDNSNTMRLLCAPSVNPPFRRLKLFFRPFAFLKLIFRRKWSTSTIIFLIMQTLENSMKISSRNFPFFHLKIQNNQHNKIPAYIQEGQDLMKKYAKKINGEMYNSSMEVLFNTSSTAHILGGVTMGNVIDENFKVIGYDNFYILDGSVIPANIGVNPSLTITAISEYAMSLVPLKVEND